MKLIEDCSPYYIRFHFDEITDIIDICNEALLDDNEQHNFKKQNLKFLKITEEKSNKIISLLPFSKDLKLTPHRMLLFITEPTGFSNIHKDSLDHRVSFNISVKVLDNKCKTNWWLDKDVSHLEKQIIDNPIMKSRNLIGDASGIIPSKSTSFIEGEFLLINTDIYHNYDNSDSDNQRIILTMRSVCPEKIYFNDAKRALLKYI